MKSTHFTFIVCIYFHAVIHTAVWAQWTIEEDQQYIAKFHEKFKRNNPVLHVNEYANAERYDKLYMGDPFEKDLAIISNNQGGIAWGWSYRMMSLNEMYKVTKDRKYLSSNLKAIQAILAVRDDKLGLPLWTGETAPAWGSDKYAERGRAVFAVHTGMILYPMFECLTLIQSLPDSAIVDESLLEDIQKQLMESLEFHDKQFREGPGMNEAHYIGLNQENVIDKKPLPGNRLSAMGRALLYAYKLNANPKYQKRARQIGNYIRNRFIQSDGNVFYWSYWLPTEPVTQSIPIDEINGEDISHGSLTMTLLVELSKNGKSFLTEADNERLIKTVTQGFARLNNGILFGSVTGNPNSNPAYVQIPARWLILSPFNQEIYNRISDFYLNYIKTPGPLDMSLLMRYSNPH